MQTRGPFVILRTSEMVKKWSSEFEKLAFHPILRTYAFTGRTVESKASMRSTTSSPWSSYRCPYLSSVNATDE